MSAHPGHQQSHPPAGQIIIITSDDDDSLSCSDLSVLDAPDRAEAGHTARVISTSPSEAHPAPGPQGGGGLQVSSPRQYVSWVSSG